MPVLAIILIKVVSVALAAWLVAYLLNSSVKMIFGATATLAAAVGGWGNMILIGGVAYAAYAGGVIKI